MVSPSRRAERGAERVMGFYAQEKLANTLE